MNKLPVLFVSCNAERLQAQGPAGFGPARMIRGKPYSAVVLISTSTEIDTPEILQLKGSGVSADKAHSLLAGQGFKLVVRSGNSAERESLLRTLLTAEPGELAELRLNTGMSEQEYRRVGVCLEVLREQDVLIICLDDKTGYKNGSGVALHESHLRDMLNSWVQNQQWGAVMSFKGDAGRQSPGMRLDDPTVCLLNAAFTLGGSRFPQRMFSSGMDNAAQTLSGFGWMR